MSTDRPWTMSRIAGGIGRRVPLRPLRIFFPFRVWRQLFRLWLETIRVQPDRSKALRELLEIYTPLQRAQARRPADGAHAGATQT